MPGIDLVFYTNQSVILRNIKEKILRKQYLNLTGIKLLKTPQ